MPDSLLDCPAPAKLNLMLHVTGRRADGYHLLETVFQLIDLDDRIDFHLRDDARIVRGTTPGVRPPDWPEDADLAVRAARALREAAGAGAAQARGVTITVRKRIPVGGGLGGGSSDAATTLLALNRLWALDWPRERLAALALGLGADVPVFVRGCNAYARGVGEDLTPLALPERHFVVVAPEVAVPTASVFGAEDLTRDTEPLTMQGFSRGISEAPNQLPGRNDLQPPVTRRFPAVANALSVLRDTAAGHGVHPSAVRMSGSGACVFAAVASQAVAGSIASTVRGAGVGTVHECTSLSRHPMT